MYGFDDGFQSWADSRYERKATPMPRIGSPFELLPALLVVGLSGAILAGAIVLPIARALSVALRGNVFGAAVGLGRWFLWRRLLLEARLIWNTEGRTLIRKLRR